MSRCISSRSVSVCCIAAIATFLMAWPALAQGPRVALVIGNSAYIHATPLANPVNDANAVAEALKGLGFDVLLGLDLDKRGLDGKVREFSRVLVGADAGIFFYAGHGLQITGRNYLVPIDAQLQGERDIDFEAVALDFVLKQMELEREGKTNVVFLDACRDNPLSRNLARSMGTRSANVGQGLAQVQAGVGTFIAYSTQPGNVALDGNDSNSPFTAALVRSIKAPGHNLTSVMIDVRKQVLAATGGRQVPWDHSALTGEFYFGSPSLSGAQPNASAQSVAEIEAMQARLRQVEEQLKNRPDARQTVSYVRLEQIKEQVRRIEEANRADQQRIFEIYRTFSASPDPKAKVQINRDVGAIQLQIGRRAAEQKTLKEEIAKLEAEASRASQ
jgi:uncharacterized caspase-like protein